MWRSIIITWSLGLHSRLLLSHCFQFLLGLTIAPKRNWQQCLCKMLEPGGQQRVLWYFLKKAYSSKLPTLSSFMATLKACSGKSADLQKYIKTLHSWTHHNAKTFWKWGRSVLEFNHPTYIEWDLAMSFLYEWKLYSKMGLDDRVAHLFVRV